jgi:hypothetical protein
MGVIPSPSGSPALRVLRRDVLIGISFFFDQTVR